MVQPQPRREGGRHVFNRGTFHSEESTPKRWSPPSRWAGTFAVGRPAGNGGFHLPSLRRDCYSGLHLEPERCKTFLPDDLHVAPDHKGGRQTESRPQSRPSAALALSHGTPGFPWLRATAEFKSRKSSNSSTRERSRAISWLKPRSVGLRTGRLLIAVGIFAVFDNVDEDPVFFEREKHPTGSDSQAVFPFPPGKFLYVALQVRLQGVELLTDVLALLFGEAAQLRQGLVADLQPVTHSLGDDGCSPGRRGDIFTAGWTARRKILR